MLLNHIMKGSKFHMGKKKHFTKKAFKHFQGFFSDKNNPKKITKKEN